MLPGRPTCTARPTLVWNQPEATIYVLQCVRQATAATTPPRPADLLPPDRHQESDRIAHRFLTPPTDFCAPYPHVWSWHQAKVPFCLLATSLDPTRSTLLALHQAVASRPRQGSPPSSIVPQASEQLRLSPTSSSNQVAGQGIILESRAKQTPSVVSASHHRAAPAVLWLGYHLLKDCPSSTRLPEPSFVVGEHSSAPPSPFPSD
jgi:hypothetical protein